MSIDIELWKLIVAVVVAIFGSTGFWTWVNNKGKNKTNEAKLLIGIAYRSIISQAEKYIKRGYITTDEFNELNHYLYEPYKNMGGNGTVEKLMDEVRKLPCEVPKEAGH